MRFNQSPINWGGLEQAGDSYANNRQAQMNRAYQNLYDPRAWQARAPQMGGFMQMPGTGGFAQQLMGLGRLFGWGR